MSVSLIFFVYSIMAIHFTEDLTKLVPLKVSVVSGEKTVFTCPCCKKKFPLSSSMVKRLSGKGCELTCHLCEKRFLVQVEVKPRRMETLQVSITDISNNQTFKNISVQQLTPNCIDFICKGQQCLSKGQKVQVNFIDPQTGRPGNKSKAVVQLVRGKYVSCHFVEPVDIK